MKVNCDTDKMLSISDQLTIETERFKEIIKKLYSYMDNLPSNGWAGSASEKYANYLDRQKSSYEKIYQSLVNFNGALKRNIKELELAALNSRVNKND